MLDIRFIPWLIASTMLLLLLLSTPAQAAPRLHLEASTVQSEFMVGDYFTVSAHLFNDGDEAVSARLAITPAAGFDLADLQRNSGTLLPGSSLSADWTYQVAPSTPPGLARFVVVAYDETDQITQSVTVTIRVCCATSPGPEPPPIYRTYLPAFR